MKNSKNIIIFAMAAAASAVTAQAQYANGDLLIGFTSSSSTQDTVFDLGAASSILASSTSLDLSSSISLPELTSSFGNLNNLSFGIIGAGSGKVYSTVTSPGTLSGVSAYNTVFVTVLNAGSAVDGSGSPANSAVVDRTVGYGNSWTEAVTGSGNTFVKAYGDPMSTTPSSFTSGTVLENLYLTKNDGSAPVLEGTFALGSSGSLSFTPVPEPGMLSFLAGLGILSVGFRRSRI
jgi:hypothetical protein